MAYWIASVALIGFGLVAGFSIGQPFFLIGLAMLVLGAFRRHPLVFWPPMLAVIAYNITYWIVTLLALWCETRCSSLPGLSVQDDGNALPLRSVVFVALAVAAIVLIVTFAMMWRARRRGQPPGSTGFRV